MIATRHVEMLLPPVIGTTTFSSQTQPHTCATFLARNSVAEDAHSLAKRRPEITKPVRVLEPIACNKKFDINNRLFSSSSCNALSSTTASMSQDNTVVTIESGESASASACDTNVFFDCSNNGIIKNKNIVNPTSSSEFSQMCNNAMPRTAKQISDYNGVDVDNVIQEAAIVLNTNTASPSLFAEHDNTLSSPMQVARNSSSKVRSTHKRKTKKSSPHYVFERLTLTSAKASEQQIEHKDKDHEEQLKNNDDESNVLNRVEENTCSNAGESKLRDAKNLVVANSNYTNLEESDEVEKRRIALLQQFHHDVDVIENKGKELIRSQSCSSALLASSLSKWRERMNSSTQEICMANSFVIHEINNKKGDSNIRERSHVKKPAYLQNYNSQSSKNCTRVKRDYYNGQWTTNAKSAEKQKQFIVPLRADSDSEDEEEESEYQTINATVDGENRIEKQKCTNIDNDTKMWIHKTQQQANRKHINKHSNQINNNNNNVNSCRNGEHREEETPYDDVSSAIKWSVDDTACQDDDMDDMIFSFAQYRKSSVRLSRSPSQTRADTTA